MAVSNIELRVNSRNAVRELTRVNKVTNTLQDSVTKLGVRLAQLEVARRYFKGFVEADKAAAAVRTLGVNSEKLQRQLLKVSNETKGLVSQTQLLKASYDVASAGFNDAASAANILKAATLGAVGGLSDLNTVADATTSVLNAYGLSSAKASKIVDGFIQTQNDGKIVVAQYAQQIGRVAPIAAAAGVGIEDLNAAISAVTATGVPVESTFAGLRQAIASVIKPTEEARKTSELLGLEFSSAAIKTKGFGGFLADVIKKTGGSEVALTKLFGSVEAVATILPLANDGLEKFNTSLDNQKKSAGAAEKATEDLGGTVSSQVSSIINNIGNVARSLDTVLGPAIKNIVTGVNDIISAASTAISKFQDLATGAVSRSAAALQAFANTGFASESAFTALKESIGTLRPGLAQSETDLLRLEGALDEAGRAALRFTGKGEFGRLRNDVLDTITAMRKLIISRRELLAQQDGTQTTTTTEDPELAALRERVNQLLQQLSAGSGTGKATKESVDASKELLDLNTKLFGGTEQLSELEKINLGFQIQRQEILDRDLGVNAEKIALLQAQAGFEADLLSYREDQIRLEEQAANLAESERKKREAEEKRRLEADPGYQMRQQLEELLELENQVAAGATAIGNAFANSFKSVITGSKSAEQALADMMSSVAEHFMDMAAQIIAKQLAIITYGLIMKALGVAAGSSKEAINTESLNQIENYSGIGSDTDISGIALGLRANGGPVLANQPYIVGERGPELFMPSASGMVLNNNQTRNQLALQSEAMRGNISEDGLPGSTNTATRQQLIQQQNNMATNSTREVERTYQTALANPNPLDVRFESTVINNTEYVTAEQHRRGMAQAAEQGRALTLQALQNSVKSRRKVGLA